MILIKTIDLQGTRQVCRWYKDNKHQERQDVVGMCHVTAQAMPGLSGFPTPGQLFGRCNLHRQLLVTAALLKLRPELITTTWKLNCNMTIFDRWLYF